MMITKQSKYPEDGSRLLPSDATTDYAPTLQAAQELAEAMRKPGRGRPPDMHEWTQAVVGLLAGLSAAGAPDVPVRLTTWQSDGVSKVEERIRQRLASAELAELVEVAAWHYLKDDENTRVAAGYTLGPRLRAALPPAWAVRRHRDAEVVLLRDTRLVPNADPKKRHTKKRLLLPLPESAEVAEWRRVLRAHADLMTDTECRVDGQRIHGAAFWMRRIFSRGSMTLGGRLYGDASNWPGARRNLIEFARETTVEPDIVGMHPSILSARERIALALHDDPYQPEGDREKFKESFNKLLNANSAAMERGRNTPGWRGILDSDHPLRHWFGRDVGVELQYRDSEMTMAVLRYLVDRGVPCFPIHDSWVVRRTDIATLEDALAVGRARLSKLEGHDVPLILRLDDQTRRFVT